MPSAIVAATITNLLASPATDGIALQATFTDPHQPNSLSYLKTTVVEFWASQTNDRTTASKVTEGAAAGGTASAKHGSGLAGDIWYYWARSRQETGQIWGDFYPISPTAGVVGLVFTDSESWVSYTPIVTTTGGPLGSYTATGMYKINGKACKFTVEINILVSDAGSGAISFTLPLIAAGGLNLTTSGTGWIETSPALLQCFWYNLGGSDEAVMYRYDGAYPGIDGSFLHASGEYPIE